MTIARESLQLLHQVPLFRGISDADFQALVAVATSERHGPGEIAISEGTPPTGLHVIEQGEFEVRKAVAEGPPRVLARLSRGECFGEMSVIGDDPHSATVVALSAATCVVVRKAAFREVLFRSPALGVGLLAVLASRLRQANENVREVAAIAREIESLSRVVGRVSNQTHILAINAGVEAARAGDSGRGFAVMAKEMRQLADETKGAAARIESLTGQVRARTR